MQFGKPISILKIMYLHNAIYITKKYKDLIDFANKRIISICKILFLEIWKG